MGKTLVAYFSTSGVTKGLAERLASAIGADIYEIVPKQPYTDADLDWKDKKSRSSVEMNDKSSRPEITGKIDNMADYDTIYLGFPIWWYTAPTVINTFLEQYDLSSKTVIPFATSGSSGMGDANRDLEPSCRGAVLKGGKRFSASAGEAELRQWAESIV